MSFEGELEEVAFDTIEGWNEETFADIWPVFLASCRSLTTSSPVLRIGRQETMSQLRIAEAALLRGIRENEPRRFFEAHFQAYRIYAGPGASGFVTAYYEPVVRGSLDRTAEFTAPILARPRNLPSSAEGMQSVYPDRAAIRTGEIASHTDPVLWLRDSVEVFMIQVQGSARVSLPDGVQLRLVYDGRNGSPYTSIGRILIDRGYIDADRMSLSALKSWLRDHGSEDGGLASAIMNENKSYVFFRSEPVGDVVEGPIGGQGLPLSKLRSIAVDRTIWPYGLPFWVDARLPWRGAEPEDFRRLLVAQDTGSAIVGPARADLFFGSGPAAGDLAGCIRHPAAVTVLLPRTAA